MQGHFVACGPVAPVPDQGVSHELAHHPLLFCFVGTFVFRVPGSRLHARVQLLKGLFGNGVRDQPELLVGDLECSEARLAVRRQEFVSGVELSVTGMDQTEQAGAFGVSQLVADGQEKFLAVGELLLRFEQHGERGHDAGILWLLGDRSLEDGALFPMERLVVARQGNDFRHDRDRKLGIVGLVPFRERHRGLQNDIGIGKGSAMSGAVHGDLHDRFRLRRLQAGECLGDHVFDQTASLRRPSRVAVREFGQFVQRRDVVAVDDVFLRGVVLLGGAVVRGV